ncbi:putative hydrolase or acyltransferase of alpha/beta superfamily [Mycolicibacterium rhodesiae NBB3]|uniref:Putative hydrolase or acyltransferase of alpha/beta superfamily n=1 Tax=Mycolicibacterium rhodesiae (strain NBB3) TaxID=710685 RepID=G8RQ36_MYCRN|nr:alpha/beta fold hydrolase [Mycolicibacterium rhodesiae]AEV75109.1 putative hydrolase or acyltransferase of alpha/beta superfamily [Mycolicibacterium rhodesiae NBB3]
MTATVDGLVRLRDGRSLAYTQYGAPHGFPVVNSHGGLACRLDVAAADSIAVDAGVRLISPDRPGVGLSDPSPGRTLADWARDVEELLDHIGVDRFAAMGWSMGGQYAVAVGHFLRPRATRVAIIAGALPLTEPGVFDQLPAMDRHLTRLSQRAPWLARQWFQMMGFLPRVAPALYGRLAARALGPADAAVVAGDGFELFSRMTRDAMRQPAGAAEEYRAWMRPWGFAPEDLDMPVDIWAGAQDQLVDPSWAHRLASRIPNATLNVRDGGHFLAHLHYREIFDSLRGGSTL